MTAIRNHILRTLMAGLCLVHGAATWASPTYVQPDRKATSELADLLANGNCGRAVAALKDGVKSKQPDVLLLAGRMFEEGWCVKPNWDKAAQLYLLANEAGNLSAIPRLAAGYAVAGRDNGSALWWAAQRIRNLPDACKQKADPVADLDAFNAELERMPPALFQACVYTAGVVAEVMAEGRFPPVALRNGISGEVQMEFKPSTGTITWRHKLYGGGQPYGIRDMSEEQFKDPRAIDKSLLTYMTQKGQVALARYRKPEGIDPSYLVQLVFEFTID